MVVGTSLAVATVMTAGAAAPAAAGAVVAGTSGGVAVGTATAAGAITGAAGGTAGAVATCAVAGATSAAGVGGMGTGIAAALAVGSGPVGWLVLGAETGSERFGITYYCWKPVLHDTSLEPSTGMLLKDNVSVSPGTVDGLPNIVFENIWKEKFEVQYFVILESNMLVCHSKAL